MADKGENHIRDSHILICRDGAMRLQVRLEGRTVWLNQRHMAELYQVSVKTVNEHLVNIYAEGELNPDATIRKFRIVQREGVRKVTRAGNISHELAEEHAQREFEKYDDNRRRLEAKQPSSDFDRFVGKTKKLEKLPSPARRQSLRRKKGGLK